MSQQDNTPTSSAATKPGKRPRPFWLLAGTVALLGVGGAVMVGQQAPPAAAAAIVETEPVMRLHPLEVTTVMPQALEELVNVTGTIQPVQQADIAAQVSGLAEAVMVQPGDVVAKGDILVEVGTTDLSLVLRQQQSTMATSAVQLRAAQTSLSRTQTLFDKGLTAQTTLDTAQAEVDQLAASVASLETQVAQAQTNLDRATVRAPFGGVVSMRSIEPGQTVSQGTPLLSLVDLSSVQIEVIAALSDTNAVKEGQPVRLSVQGAPDRVYTASVDRISPVAETGTRSIKIYLSLENADGALRGGMFVTGAIVTRAENDVLAVPATAIRTEGTQAYVLSVENGALARRDVVTGAGWAGDTLLQAEGLSAGTQIVSTQLPQLVAGMAVTIEQGF